MSTNPPPILVVNNGSSSLKFSVLDPRRGVVLSSGVAERIGTEEGTLNMTDLEQVRHRENPANALGIRVAADLFGGKPQVAVFDTAFHPEIDPKLNDQNGKNSDGRITTGSGLLCLVIPTNEELMIARETDRLVS